MAIFGGGKMNILSDHPVVRRLEACGCPFILKNKIREGHDTRSCAVCQACMDKDVAAEDVLVFMEDSEHARMHERK